jgi:hypothetical protein
MKNTENTITENTITEKPLYFLEGSGGSYHQIDIVTDSEDRVASISADTYEECLELAFQKVKELGGDIHPDCKDNKHSDPWETWEQELYKKYFG